MCVRMQKVHTRTLNILPEVDGLWKHQNNPAQVDGLWKHQNNPAFTESVRVFKMLKLDIIRKEKTEEFWNSGH